MREVEFRTIDRLFIKMSINDKMWVIFLLFLVALTSVAGSRYFNEIQQFEQQAISASEAKLSGIVDAQSNRATEIDGVSKSNRVSESSLSMGLSPLMPSCILEK